MRESSDHVLCAFPESYCFDMIRTALLFSEERVLLYLKKHRFSSDGPGTAFLHSIFATMASEQELGCVRHVLMSEEWQDSVAETR